MYKPEFYLQSLNLGAHVQQELLYGSVCVCVCYVLDYLLHHCGLAEDKCLFGNNIIFSRILTRGFR